jgi:hypothetical protein
VKVAPFLAELERQLQALGERLSPARGEAGGRKGEEEGTEELLVAARQAVADLDELCAALLGIG